MLIYIYSRNINMEFGLLHQPIAEINKLGNEFDKLSALHGISNFGCVQAVFVGMRELQYKIWINSA